MIFAILVEGIMGGTFMRAKKGNSIFILFNMHGKIHQNEKGIGPDKQFLA